MDGERTMFLIWDLILETNPHLTVAPVDQALLFMRKKIMICKAI